ncbi:hypothetical protein GF314_11425 [bacterium]|nr:hypothetical protein [bacterium]
MTDAPLAAIDVGSHSVKLTIAHRRDDGTWQRDREDVRITGLGLGDVGRDGLPDEGRRRTLAALSDFCRIGRQHGVVARVAAGTAVLRRARDADRFVREVAAATGLELEIVSGEDEARLAYRGAVALLPAPDGTGLDLACDIGGRSTEVAWGRGPELLGRQSLDLGTITLTRAFGLDGPVDGATVARARAAVDARLAEVPDPGPVRRLLGIGATPGSVLALYRGEAIADGDRIHGQPLPAAVIDAQIARLTPLSLTDRRALDGLHPDRAAVILAGTVILAGIAARWSSVAPTISAAGLREGLLVERFGDRTASS